jgi:phosphoribosylformylglycinamidine synthase
MNAAIRIEVEPLIESRAMVGCLDAARHDLKLDISHIEKMDFYKVGSKDLSRIALQGALEQRTEDVFTDALIQKAHLTDVAYDFKNAKPQMIIEVGFKPGVTDNAAHSLKDILKITGLDVDIASGQLYFLFGNVDKIAAQKLASDVIANDLIQKIDVFSAEEFYAAKRFDEVHLPEVVLGEKTDILDIPLDKAALEKLNQENSLALSADEIDHILTSYTKTGKTSITDVELEIIAQSWSEHCKHKIFNAEIEYQENLSGDQPALGSQTINSLYKTWIKGATKKIQADRKIDWLISVFSDNAGIVRFDSKVDLCIKAETHNTPSALDPYGGALTGILGVNRDILGCGLGARPIVNTDVFCFAPPDLPDTVAESELPASLKSPRRIFEGVHLGVEDGGNKSGIPTVNGAFFFDRDYAGKPLVFCGTVGVLPQVLESGKASADKQAMAGDRVVMAGGAIGADGIHGATFSSIELNENSPVTAVQIGDPLTQKRLAGFLLAARDAGLYSSVTDNGAGGLSSSIGEMAQETNGADIDLALCPVKYPGLKPFELMISESQERMSFAVPPQHMAALQKLADRHGVTMTDIGQFTDNGQLTVRYGAKIVADLDLAFLHESLPNLVLKAEWDGPRARKNWHQGAEIADTRQPVPAKMNQDFIEQAIHKLLAAPNIASKEKWVRRYDHEVQAATMIKPFNGVEDDGPSDSGVIWLYPHGGEETGAIAVGCGLAPRVSFSDPYAMAQFALDEALRNVVVSGGDIDKCCILDNFCWPDPVQSARTPDGAYKLGQLVRSCKGLYDASLAYGTPMVSGKDSMKNDYRGRNRGGDEIMISVPPTLLITAMAKAVVGKTVSSGFKQAGDLIYVLGGENKGLQGSEFAALYTCEGSPLPKINPVENHLLYQAYYKACQTEMLCSGHDVSDGGMVLAVAESMIGGRLGATLDVDLDPDVLFNEGPGRFVVSIDPKNREQFESIFQDLPLQRIGVVSTDPELQIGDITLPLEAMVTTWKTAL